MPNLTDNQYAWHGALTLLVVLLFLVLLLLVVIWWFRNRICRWIRDCYRRCVCADDTSGGSGRLTVRGRITAADLPGLDLLDAVVMRVDVRPAAPLARKSLSDSGDYEATFAHGAPEDALPDIQVEVRVHVDDRIMGVSPVFMEVPAGTLQVDIPLRPGTKPAISEFEDLHARLGALYGADRQIPDPVAAGGAGLISYAAAKTGWDARALAMASLAIRLGLAQPQAHALAPELFYALFRAGVPGIDGAVFRIAADQAVTIWTNAGQQGVIKVLSANDLAQAKVDFLAQASQTLLALTTTPGTSALGDVLAVSFPGDVATQQSVAGLLAEHGADAQSFWAQAGNVLSPVQVARLNTDVQLANFTFGSAPLMLHLRHDLVADATNLEGLAMAGYGEPGRWQGAVSNLQIPAVVEGDAQAAREARYAELLSAQLRLEYPVAAMSHAVAQGLVPINAATRAPMATFLVDNRSTYRLGEEPLEQYLARTQAPIADAVRIELKKVERVFQMTPTDQSMRALLGQGIHSAWQVVQFSPKEFTSRYAVMLGGQAVADQVVAKAHQIHATVANLAIAFHAAQAAPPLGSSASPLFVQTGLRAQVAVRVGAEVGPQAAAAVAAEVGAGGLAGVAAVGASAAAGASATLQSLFGELDYCACDHCRSILSPAAYLVGLLQLCDPVGDPPQNQRRPIDELFQRRPDLQHLPLTCDNTNVPLPQIDLANEALEYFVDSLANSAASPMTGFQGFSTSSDVTSQELSTEPQNVRASAYTWLSDARFPMMLPFDEPLESLRHYLEPFDRPLAQAMEALRDSDNLERANAQSYAWRDILLEELRISRAERDLLTDSALSIRALYGFPAAGGGEPAVPDSLRKAGSFATRIGITFAELAEILQTRFVNPNSWVLPMASRLGVTLAQINKFVASADTPANTAAFEALLAADLDKASYGNSVSGWVRANSAILHGLLTLHDPSQDPDPCDFSAIEFRYGDLQVSSAREIEFVRLARFIRLWRKLAWPPSEPDGPPVPWSIGEVDVALSALYPLERLPLTGVEADDLTRLDAGFDQALLRLAALHRLMRVLGLHEPGALQPLLSCIAPMQGVAAGSLYRELFLSAGFLRQYPVFAVDASALPINDNAATFASQGSALQAACQINSRELALMVKSASIAANATLADQPTDADLQILLGAGATEASKQYARRHLRTRRVTTVYAHSWLARALKVNPEELLALSEASGLSLDAELGGIDGPHPPNKLEALVRLVLGLRAAKITPAAALLVFWNRDLLGAAGSTPAAALSFAKRCRAELAAIDAALQPKEDPEGRSVAQLLASTFGAATAGTYMAFIERTAVTEEAFVYNASELPATVQAVNDGGLAFDAVSKRLRYSRGRMPDALRAAFVGINPEPVQDFRTTVQAIHTKSALFLDQLVPEALRQAHNDFQASGATLEQRRSALLATVIDIVKPLQRRQALLKLTAQALDAPESWAAELMTNSAALCSSGNSASEALSDLLAIGIVGLRGDYFDGGVVVAQPSSSDPDAGAIDYGDGHPRTLPGNVTNPGQAIACQWTGYVEPPEGGPFHLSIETDGVATPALEVDGADVDLQPVAVGRPIWRTNVPIALAPKSAVAFKLSVTDARRLVVARWQPSGAAEAPIPAQVLYQPGPISDMTDTFGRAVRGRWVRSSFELSDAESMALLTLPALRLATGGARAWLAGLPIREKPSAQLAQELDKVLRRLLDYCRVRSEIGASSESMLPLLRDPVSLVALETAPLMRQAGWTATTVDAALQRLGKQVGGQADRAALLDPASLARIHDLLRALGAWGVSPDDAFKAIGNAPGGDDVRSLYAAMRARHEASDWSTLIKPINDRLRLRRRDSLVAYALAALANRGGPISRIDTANRLYEYLLLDVLVHPRVETSRIRAAIAAVQQFIQRCVELPNSEPADIHIPLAMREQWPWMKRYRVWEANRKVFLYPENWLEPELRDDQSPFFRETLSELLQGDITEDRAAEAMLGYLRKLEEVSQLEPCGLHVDNRETASDATDDVLHVLARNNGANRKYHYRRREPSGWTPWEQVKLDIEDNPVLPYRWKGRLFVFWLKTLQEADKLAAPSLSGSTTLGNQSGAVLQPKEPQQRITAMLCWSEYAQGKWGATRTSSTERAVFLGLFTAAGGSRPFIRANLQLRAEMAGAALQIKIDDAGLGSPGTAPLQTLAYFQLHNAFSEPDAASLVGGSVRYELVQYPARACWTFDAGSNTTAMSVTHKTDTVLSRWFPTLETLSLFRRRDGAAGTCVAPGQDVLSIWHRTAPFFYSDSKYKFLVTPIHVDVKAVSSGPLTTWVPGTVTKTIPTRVVVTAEEDSGYVRPGKPRVLIDSEQDFEAGAIRFHKYSARVDNL